MNWIKSMLNNSPSPAFQLPYYVPKELFVPEVIKELSQNSRPTPLALNKGIPAPVDKQTSLANASAARQKIFDNSGRKPIPQFPISSPLVLPDVTVVGKKTTKDSAAASRKEGLRKAFHPEEFVKKSSYDNKGKSAAEVIELQRRLGVTADGKWGANTQKAYENSMMDQKAKDTDLGPIRTRPGNIKSEKPKQKLATNWLPPDYKQKGGTLTNNADSTKYFNDKLKNNIKEHFNAKTSSDKEVAVKKVNQTKANLLRQENKNKVGFDKNGFPVKKQNGGEMPKGGDQAAIYKKGKDVKVPKKGKIDASKWKK